MSAMPEITGASAEQRALLEELLAGLPDTRIGRLQEDQEISRAHALAIAREVD